MEPSFLIDVLLPVTLAVIMFGMGLSLTFRDFSRLFKTPTPVLAGLLGQILLLPVLAYCVVRLFNLDESLAIGLMILAACPGGTTSNIISQVCRANLALSVSLTAIATLICVFTTPLIIAWSMAHFSGAASGSFSLFETTIGLIIITLLPVLLGLVVRHFFEGIAVKSEVFFRRFSGVFMIVLIIVILSQNWATFVTSFGQVAGASLSLNIAAVLLGLTLGYLFKLGQRDAITLSIEVGMQNATVAMTIATVFLARQDLAVTASVYGVVMYLGAIIPAWLSKNRHRELAEK